MAGSGTQELFPKTRSRRTTAVPELSLSPRFISREESFEAYSMSTDLSKRRERKARIRAKGSQSCGVRPGRRRFRFAVNADRRSRSVESPPRPDRGGPLRYHQRRRASRRRDGDANDAQAGTRTGRPCAEAGSTGKPCDTIGGVRCGFGEGDRSRSAFAPAQMSLRAGSPQRILTNAAHSAARIAPAKT